MSTNTECNPPNTQGSLPTPPFVIEELIAKHQAGVWRYLRALGCDGALADDLTQDTFLAVYRHPFQLINDLASASYLRRVAFHLLVSQKRRQGRMLVISDFETFDQEWVRWAGYDGGDAALEILAECFERLTTRAQHALRMRFAENASRDQIAAALGIGEHGAKNLMQRAKSHLRECLESRLS